ncbi:peptide ABC transporter substrate-binding protein [Bacillus mojavensis]|uniref:peptide ABC transporter substrate-binding protein n=1 Tax=Bacillus mojavensis TaxID=72360 RepID=UPI002DB6582C|nr:peptide ABC transporter substrate-binding protein [Bacillus mojavensis]MEC1291561.1 peptide ABC transporter substrate-binding protein [Bacillus mojavensis]MEC1705392.1 peptide ABC transporter substrate-binding protein [Bacillus mojavensis]MEC5245558.1 peptide ABC transporter substrate-binding protein [Bacillus mojavensis]
MSNYRDYILKGKDVAVFEIDTDPISLDPAKCDDYIGQIISQAMFEPLFIRDIETEQWVCGAAENFEVSSDGLTYIFNLRKDRFWSDGIPVVAQDFVFAFQRLFHPKINSPIGQILSFIKNGEEILNGVLPVTELGVEALGPRKLKISLTECLPFLPSILGSPNTSPFPYRTEQVSWTDERLNITNGAYVLKEYKSGQFVRLERNPFYPNSSSNHVKDVLFVINRELDYSLQNYEKGNIDVTCNTYFPFEEIKRFKQRDDFYMFPSGILFFLQFGNRNDLFKKKQARQALYYIVNKSQIAQTLHGGIIPWDHFASIGVSEKLFDDQSNYCYHPEKAVKLWKQEERENQALSILYADFFPNGEICHSIKSEMEKHLGITLTLEGCSFEDFVIRHEQREYDLCLALLSPLYNDPFNYFQYFLSELSEEDEDEFIDILQKALGDEKENHCTYYKKANDYLLEKLPSIPLFNGQSIFLKNPFLKGYKIFKDGSISIQNLSWGTEEKPKL